MEPTLESGQGLIALRTSTAAPGQLRCVEHPEQPDFWLVKRVASVNDHNGVEMMHVMSDNSSVDTIDSRRFGDVPVAGSYRVVVRIPLRLM